MHILYSVKRLDFVHNVYWQPFQLLSEENTLFVSEDTSLGRHYTYTSQIRDRPQHSLHNKQSSIKVSKLYNLFLYKENIFTVGCVLYCTLNDSVIEFY